MLVASCGVLLFIIYCVTRLVKTKKLKVASRIKAFRVHFSRTINNVYRAAIIENDKLSCGV